MKCAVIVTAALFCTCIRAQHSQLPSETNSHPDIDPTESKEHRSPNYQKKRTLFGLRPYVYAPRYHSIGIRPVGFKHIAGHGPLEVRYVPAVTLLKPVFHSHGWKTVVPPPHVVYKSVKPVIPVAPVVPVRPAVPVAPVVPVKPVVPEVIKPAFPVVPQVPVAAPPVQVPVIPQIPVQPARPIVFPILPQIPFQTPIVKPIHPLVFPVQTPVAQFPVQPALKPLPILPVQPPVLPPPQVPIVPQLPFFLRPGLPQPPVLNTLIPTVHLQPKVPQLPPVIPLQPHHGVSVQTPIHLPIHPNYRPHEVPVAGHFPPHHPEPPQIPQIPHIPEVPVHHPQVPPAPHPEGPIHHPQVPIQPQVPHVPVPSHPPLETPGTQVSVQIPQYLPPHPVFNAGGSTQTEFSATFPKNPVLANQPSIGLEPPYRTIGR